MNRRGFLGSILAAAVAPAIIRTPGLLMPIKPGLVSVVATADLDEALWRLSPGKVWTKNNYTPETLALTRNWWVDAHRWEFIRQAWPTVAP